MTFDQNIIKSINGQTVHGHAAGRSGSRTYRTWQHMLQRCTNPDSDGYAGYGARGISVCERWFLFVNFLEDMGIRPENTSIDRIDGTLGYYQGNCKWATTKEQSSHKRLPSLYANNSSGLVGVSFDKSKNNWQAYYFDDNKKQKRLYQGKDYFSACCARKSWELKCPRRTLS